MIVTLANGEVVSVVGSPTFCKACGASMYWALTKNNRRAPIVQTDKGWVNHFVNCPQASRFKKPKPKKYETFSKQNAIHIDV